MIDHAYTHNQDRLKDFGSRTCSNLKNLTIIKKKCNFNN